ncbi:type IV secretory system conjugative DNA transfer family protein [Rahnella perminowiae]|uniref:type IV secretory system conjugative DNA transfer family protein n=1 Tax=Rahnella perminowiae TaxID=2816244 RepID=UPI00215C7D63|nr:type IV secretory system conjugative DNA transfer family protein [Rahnella perminowiae]MCR8998694.1 type IV secretory system conjugative DNA transfer family protein [Rahnella perminowiae]
MSRRKKKDKDVPPGWAWVGGKLMQQEIVTFPALILGKDPYSDHFIAAYGQSYLMLAAPPASGKDVGIVTPNLLQYPHSIVSNDIKFESFHDTAGFRAACGQKVYRFSPGLLETHHWNPFRIINTDSLYRLGELRSMAASLYIPDNEKNASWFQNASSIFVALALFIIESEGEYPLSLPQMYEIVSLGTQLGSWVQKQIDERNGQGRPLSDETVRELNAVISATKAKEFATLLDFITRPLKVYGEKTVALAVTDSDNPADNIDFSRLREEPTTVYFCVTEPELTKFAPLMNLFYSQAIRANSKVLPKHGGHCEDGSLRFKYQVLFMMNEFAIMKRMEVMETAPALTRGNGLRYAIFFQNENQVCASDCYGKEGGKALMGTFHIEVVFAPGDIDVATEYSKRLGNRTVRVPSDNINVSEGQRRSKGRNWSLQPRALMLPQEIDELPYDDELIFMAATNKTPSMKIRAKKIKWYEEKIFQERVNRERYPLPPVPVGNVERLKGLVKSVIQPNKGVKLATPQGDDIRHEDARRVRADVPEVNRSNPK